MSDSVVEPVNDNEYKGEYEIEKYQDLAREMRNVWNKTVMVVPSITITVILTI